MSRIQAATRRPLVVKRGLVFAAAAGMLVAGLLARATSPGHAATPDALEEIKDLFEWLDGTFSRFRPESELNLVNAGSAEFVAVSPLFARALALAPDSARRTDGLVDPTP